MIRYRREDDALVATSEIAVGVDRITVSVRLGAWPFGVPDAGGLRGAPVVVVPAEDLVGLAVAGIRRSGGLDPLVVADARSSARITLQAGPEVAVVVGHDREVLEDLRGVGGRPLPALPLDDAAAVDAWVRGCRVDLDLAVPSGADDVRSAARAALARATVPAMHHVVEVDPRPAFDELGSPIEHASLTMLAAAAAGVLAGRVAARNRRWHATS
ncbi:MAG TPA: hypothetical protein VLA82_12850 [Actinomycetota bacterium]|nr:hypothetical protein [Actinomycetota bacterium]